MYFFTYHRIAEVASPGKRDFYTVSPRQFARHLDLLKEHGGECLHMDELLTATSVPEKKFVLSFDDATTDHYEVVLPRLRERGWQGVFFVPTSRLNTPGHLTNIQVRELAAAGQVVGLHSHEHSRMDQLPDEEIRRQIALSQKILGDVLGERPMLFVPPGGFVSGGVRRVAVECGVRAMRTMRWGYNQKLDLMALETIPINHYTDDRKFVKLLHSRNAPFLYVGKEALKKIVPLTTYEWARRWLFKLSGRK